MISTAHTTDLIRDIVEGHNWEDTSESGRTTLALINAMGDYLATRNKLILKTQYWSARFKGMCENIAAGASVNSLGEVQGNTQEIDRLCTSLHYHAQMVKMLCGIKGHSPTVVMGDLDKTAENTWNAYLEHYGEK